MVPADRTLREHRDALLTPTEYLIATRGLRHARNKRGRGSTDLRALVIGEMGEIDECKMSLVMAAKTGGFWERMSRDERETNQQILDSFKTLLKESRWPLMLILSGVPSLATHVAKEEQLARLLRTVRFEDIDLSREADMDELLHLTYSYAKKAGLDFEPLARISWSVSPSPAATVGGS